MAASILKLIIFYYDGISKEQMFFYEDGKQWPESHKGWYWTYVELDGGEGDLMEGPFDTPQEAITDAELDDEIHEIRVEFYQPNLNDSQQPKEEKQPMSTSEILDKTYRIKMPDGSVWGVPVRVIAHNRAKYYAKNHPDMGGDFEKSLNEDTIPLFESDHSEIEDWAKNNMYWSEAVEEAVEIIEAPSPDFEEGWMNGEATIK